MYGKHWSSSSKPHLKGPVIHRDWFLCFWLDGRRIRFNSYCHTRSLMNELNNWLGARGKNKLPKLTSCCKNLDIFPAKLETFRSSWLQLTKDTEKNVRWVDDTVAQVREEFQNNTRQRKIFSWGDNSEIYDGKIEKWGEDGSSYRSKKDVLITTRKRDIGMETVKSR